MEGNTNIIQSNQSSGPETKERKPLHVPFTSYRLPEPIENIGYRIDDTVQGIRHAAITAAPASVVNNSTHALATVHMASELLMLKAAHTVFVDKEAITAKHGAVKWHHYITEPPKAIIRDMSSGVKSNVKAADLLKPSFYVTSVRNLFDLNNASKVDWEAALKAQAAGGAKAKLRNTWQARATMIGMTGWGISLFIKDNKEDPQEVKELGELRKENPLGYAGKRIQQAVDFRHWSDNKAQMIGGFVTLSGMCSMLSGLRNVTKTPTHQYYRLNPAHCLTGVLTFAAGNLLLFSANKEEGFRNFGAAMLGRLVFLPSSLTNKYRADATGSKDPGRHYYAAGTAGFQTVNTMSFLFGGAEKRPDGTIVDQSGKSETEHNVSQQPENKVSDVSEREVLKEAPEVAMATA